MNKIYKYTFLIIALLTVVPALAQTDPMVTETDNLWMKKTVKDNENGTYTLNLQTYVRGSGQITSKIEPCDIVLVMDLSSSMTSTSNNVYVKNSQVEANKSLTYNTNYIYEKDGKTYYLKGFRSGSYGKYKYTFVYKEYVYPTGKDDGETLGTYESSRQYTVTTDDSIYTTTSKTRLAVLKEAANNFVETIYENNPSATEYHNIGLIGFQAGTVLYNSGSLQSATSSNLTEMQEWIDDMAKDQGTRSDLGMQEAYKMLSGENVINDGRKKVIVFFTDGCPSTSGGTYFNSSYAKAAVNIAYAAKQQLNKEINYTVTIPNANSNNSFTGTDYICQYGLGASIYSVAILSSETSGDNIHDSSITYDIRRLLHYVSSNYNFDIKGTNYYFGADYTGASCVIDGVSGTGSEEPHDYYQLSTGSNLTSIFTQIASEASGGANAQITAESAVVLDAITNKFQLPAETDVDDIRIYTCDVVENNATSTVQWKTKSNGDEDWIAWPTSGNKADYVRINGGTSGQSITGVVSDNDYLEVTGYDFAANYVGPIYEDGSITKWHGQKLIIEFEIETNPANEGGLTMATNELISGLYVKKADGTYEMATDNGEPAQFKQPTVNLPYIKIIKKGLKVGESALFRVTKVTAENSDEAVTDVTAYTADVIITRATESQNDGNAPYAILKLVYTGDYKVEELPWAWAYTHEGPKWGHLSTVEATSDTKFLTFTFTNTDVNGAAEHAESFVPNNMSVSRSVGDPKTGSTEGGTSDDETGGDDDDTEL